MASFLNNALSSVESFLERVDGSAAAADEKARDLRPASALPQLLQAMPQPQPLPLPLPLPPTQDTAAPAPPAPPAPLSRPPQTPQRPAPQPAPAPEAPSARRPQGPQASSTISAEEQIALGFQREAQLRAEVASLRQRLGDVDFDAVHRVRTECDVLSQRLASLTRDYDTLRAAAEAQAQAAQAQHAVIVREHEALEVGAAAQHGAARAREDALLEEVASLTQQLQLAQASARGSAADSGADSGGATAQHQQQQQQTRAAAAAAHAASVDEAVALASRPLNAQLALERARIAELDARCRALQASALRDRAAETDMRQQLDAASSERVAISARCEQLEAENQALRSGQSAVAALQRLANESARESSALSVQVSDFRARARAATSLLAQEQLAHQSTRVAYEELQRLFATTQQRIAAAAEPRGAGANSSASASERFATIQRTHTGVAAASLDRLAVSALAFLANNRRARSAALAYFAVLQLWAIVLVLASQWSLPVHSLHHAVAGAKRPLAPT